MKTWAKVLALLGMSAVAFASSATMDGPITDSNAALGVGATMFYTLDMGSRNMNYFSAQVVVASGSYANQTFYDGTASTGNLTVVSFTAISSATATAKMIISSNTALVNQTVFVGGNNIPIRVDLVTSSNTACNIASDIATQTVFLSTCAVGNATGIVFSTAPTFGSVYNSFSLDDSSRTAISSAAFSGGRDNQSVKIGTITLRANVDFFPVTSTALTANALYQAMLKSMSSILTSTNTAGQSVIYATATVVGPSGNYAMVSSSNAALSLSGVVTLSGSQGTSALTNGTTASYLYNGQNITLPAHGLPKALDVWISNGSGVTLNYSSATVGGSAIPLTAGTTMYVIPVDANTIQLANSSTMAVAGLPVTWISSRTATTPDAFGINVPVISGFPTWGYYGSNDNVTYTQVISSFSVSSYVYPSSSVFQDQGLFDWQWLGFKVTAPTTGAASVKALLHGQKR